MGPPPTGALAFGNWMAAVVCATAVFAAAHDSTVSYADPG